MRKINIEEELGLPRCNTMVTVSTKENLPGFTMYRDMAELWFNRTVTHRSLYVDGIVINLDDYMLVDIIIIDDEEFDESPDDIYVFKQVDIAREEHEKMLEEIRRATASINRDPAGVEDTLEGGIK